MYLYGMLDEKKEWFADWFDTTYYHTLYQKIRIILKQLGPARNKGKTDTQTECLIDIQCNLLKLNYQGW